MISALIQYFCEEGIPRFWRIVFSAESAISLAIGCLFFKWGDRFFSATPKTGDLSTGLIAYTAIALGFCIAGLTISLTLPDQDFVTRLALPMKRGEKTNAYSDLLFVFSWTAIAHWFALVTLFLASLFTDSQSPLLPPGHSMLRLFAVSFIACICTYCLCQFFITLVTLSQVGNTYISHLLDYHAKKANPLNSKADQ